MSFKWFLDRPDNRLISWLKLAQNDGESAPESAGYSDTCLFIGHEQRSSMAYLYVDINGIIVRAIEPLMPGLVGVQKLRFLWEMGDHTDFEWGVPLLKLWPISRSANREFDWLLGRRDLSWLTHWHLIVLCLHNRLGTGRKNNTI